MKDALMTYTKYLVFTVLIISFMSTLLSACDTPPPEVAETVKPAVQTPAPKEEIKKLTSGTVYAISELLYFSGTDISAADPGRQYRISKEAVDIISATTHEVIESHSSVFEYSEIDEEKWDALFTGGLQLDISGYKQRTQCKASDLYIFYILDEEVWLGTYKNNGLITMSKVEALTPIA